MSADTNNELTDAYPTRVGWYAVLCCWDELEGSFPGANYWDGKMRHPDINASWRRWPTVFKSKEEAETYAYDNDPER